MLHYAARTLATHIRIASSASSPTCTSDRMRWQYDSLTHDAVYRTVLYMPRYKRSIENLLYKCLSLKPVFVFRQRIVYVRSHSVNAIVSHVVITGKGKRQTLKEKVDSIYSETEADYEKVIPTQQNCMDMVAWIKNDMVTFNKGLDLEATALRNRIARITGNLLVDNEGR